MKITISNKIHIQGVPERFKTAMKDRLTFPNPKWLENDRLGYWNGETPRYLTCYEQADSDLIIPRGFIRHLIGMAKAQGIEYHLDDRRRTLPEVSFAFKGTLRPYQETAIQDILSHDFGTLSAPTGSGKTCMALYAIGQKKQPALVAGSYSRIAGAVVRPYRVFSGYPKR